MTALFEELQKAEFVVQDQSRTSWRPKQVRWEELNKKIPYLLKKTKIKLCPFPLPPLQEKKKNQPKPTNETGKKNQKPTTKKLQQTPKTPCHQTK